MRKKSGAKVSGERGERGKGGEGGEGGKKEGKKTGRRGGGEEGRVSEAKSLLGHYHHPCFHLPSSSASISSRWSSILSGVPLTTWYLPRVTRSSSMTSRPCSVSFTVVDSTFRRMRRKSTCSTRKKEQLSSRA